MLKTKLDELTQEAQEAAKTKTQLEKDLKASQAPIKQKEREHQVTKRELASAKKSHKNALRRLQEARDELLKTQGNAAEDERVRTRKITTTENDLAQAKVSFSTSEWCGFCVVLS